MQINITGKHMDLTPAIEEYANEKAQRLTRYFDRIEQIEVVISSEKKHHKCEMVTDVEHHDAIISHAENADLYASIDQCADRGHISRQQRQI